MLVMTISKQIKPKMMISQPIRTKKMIKMTKANQIKNLNLTHRIKLMTV